MMQMRNCLVQPAKLFKKSAVSLFSTSVHQNLIFEHVSPGVATLTLNRVEGKNSFSKDFVKEFESAINKIKSEKTLSALVLQSSVPKVFCSGADLKERLAMPDELVGAFVSSLRTLFHSVSELPCVTVVFNIFIKYH